MQRTVLMASPSADVYGADLQLLENVRDHGRGVAAPRAGGISPRKAPDVALEATAVQRLQQPTNERGENLSDVPTPTDVNTDVDDDPRREHPNWCHLCRVIHTQVTPDLNLTH